MLLSLRPPLIPGHIPFHVAPVVVMKPSLVLVTANKDLPVLSRACKKVSAPNAWQTQPKMLISDRKSWFPQPFPRVEAPWRNHKVQNLHCLSLASVSLSAALSVLPALPWELFRLDKQALSVCCFIFSPLPCLVSLHLPSLLGGDAASPACKHKRE